MFIHLLQHGREGAYTLPMQNEFTAVIEQDGEWFVGFCPEIPEANGQGRSVEECREDLSQAIALVLRDRREDALRGVPPGAIRDVVRVA
jgi:predicted RNase H-like HicB family nuclease